MGFIIAAIFFVVPVALGINYIARIGDAKHNSYEAARYALWERTVWHQSNNNYNTKADIDISREINQRVFASQAQLLDSRQDRRGVPQSQINYDANLYGWEYVRNQRSPIIEVPNRRNAEPNRLRIADQRMPGTIASGVNRVAGTMLQLDLNGFYNADIELQLLKDPNFLQQLNVGLGGNNPLVTRSNNAMLIGAWNANGPGEIRSRIRRLVPTTLLDNGVIDALRTAAATARFREFRQLDFGRVEPDRVPCQRTTGRRGGGRGC